MSLYLDELDPPTADPRVLATHPDHTPTLQPASMALLSMLRTGPVACRSLSRSISRLPLPPSIPPSALRPLVAFAPLVPRSTASLVLPASVRSIPLSTGQTAFYVQEGGSLEAGGRECWILNGGTVVGWGLESDELRAWAARLWKQRPANAAGQPSSPLPAGETEQLDFFVDSSSYVLMVRPRLAVRS